MAVEPATVIVPLPGPDVPELSVFDGEEHAASAMLASTTPRCSAARADFRFTENSSDTNDGAGNTLPAP